MDRLTMSHTVTLRNKSKKEHNESVIADTDSNGVMTSRTPSVLANDISSWKEQKRVSGPAQTQEASVVHHKKDGIIKGTYKFNSEFQANGKPRSTSLILEKERAVDKLSGYSSLDRSFPISSNRKFFPHRCTPGHGTNSTLSQGNDHKSSSGSSDDLPMSKNGLDQDRLISNTTLRPLTFNQTDASASEINNNQHLTSRMEESPVAAITTVTSSSSYGHPVGSSTNPSAHPQAGHFIVHPADFFVDYSPDPPVVLTSDLNGTNSIPTDHSSGNYADHSRNQCNGEFSLYSSNTSLNHSTENIGNGDHLSGFCQLDTSNDDLSKNDLVEELSYMRFQGSSDDPKVQETNRLASSSADNEDENKILTLRPLSDVDHAADIETDHSFFVRKAAETASPDPIFSSRGTMRGVKNRVRAGIAAFKDIQEGKKNTHIHQEKGKIILYTTSVTVVRETTEKCLKIRKILQTQMVEFEERDVFLSKETHQELINRLQKEVELPQVFVDGHPLGNAKEIERLNENGTLRTIFKNFKKVRKPKCCSKCGGYRYIPCTSCNGSKKSTRNRFTNEFLALRCTFCDDNGLIKCDKCNVATEEASSECDT